MNYNIVPENPWNFIYQSTYDRLSRWEQAMYYNTIRNLVFHLDDIRHKMNETSYHTNDSKCYPTEVISFYPMDIMSGLSFSTTTDVRLLNKTVHPKNYDEIAVYTKVNDVERMVANVRGEDAIYLRSITNFEMGRLQFLFRTEVEIFYKYTPPN